MPTNYKPMEANSPVIIVGGANNGMFVWAAPDRDGTAIMSDVHRAGSQYRFNAKHGLAYGKAAVVNFVYLEGLDNLNTGTARRLQLQALNSVELNTSGLLGLPSKNSFMIQLADYVRHLPPEQASALDSELSVTVAWGLQLMKVIEYLEYIYMTGYLYYDHLIDDSSFQTSSEYNEAVALNRAVSKNLGAEALKFKDHLEELVRRFL